MKTIAKLLIIAVFGFSITVCVAQDLTVCASSSFTIPSAQDADNAVYQWTENGVDIPGAAYAAYTNTEGKLAAGTYVYVRMAHTDDCGWQASNGYVVWVVGSGSAPAITAPADGCAGANYVFTVPAGTTYEWTGNGGTAKGNSYTYSDATAGKHGVSVRVKVAGPGEVTCTSPWASASVTVYAKPVINTQPAESQAICPGSTASLTVAASNATAYQWMKDGSSVTDGSGGTTTSYTTAALYANATYSVVAGNGACSVTSNEALVSMKAASAAECCNAQPGSTMDFTAFSPCTAQVGATWTLQDRRESKNPQDYKVKLMADGHIWMVQDLKFGDKCNKEDFAGSNGQDRLGNISSTGTYYGNCRNNTQTGAGYLYDWAAAINKPGAYYGSKTNVGCSGTATGENGTNPGACQGICPAGWHIPTGGSAGEYQALHNAIGNCTTDNDNCWDASSAWEGVLGGLCSDQGVLNSQGSYARYWSSTYYSSGSAYLLYFYSATVAPGTSSGSLHYGFSVRCVKDY
jgi:uncharacterized protein (TIGR02145 family)